MRKSRNVLVQIGVDRVVKVINVAKRLRLDFEPPTRLVAFFFTRLFTIYFAVDL